MGPGLRILALRIAGPGTQGLGVSGLRSRVSGSGSQVLGSGSQVLILDYPFKIGFVKSFGNFTGKHLYWSLFLKNLQAEGLQLHKKRLQCRCFPVKLAKFLRTPFLTYHFRWLLLHLRWLLLYCFKKLLLNSFFATLLWRTNNSFFSTHRLIYKKSCSFVYKFVVNCQVF